MHETNCEVCLFHFLGQPLDFLLLVAKNNRLRDGERVIQIEERLALVVLLFDSNEELLYFIQSQLVSLHQNLQRVVHELV